MVRRQAHWQEASSYKPLRASPPKSCMVSLKISSGLNWIFSCIGSWSINFLFCSAFRLHQDWNWKGRHRYLKRQRHWPKQVRHFLPVVEVSHPRLLHMILFFVFWFRSSVTQAHDISNPSYMGVSFQKGNVTDKGWSYSRPPKNPSPGQGSKESKKSGYDVGTGSPTGKSYPK